MKVVNQESKIICGLSPMEHVELVGRICYKSEDKIKDGSAAKFVKMLYDHKHHAMLEHYRFIMQVSPVIYELLGSIKHEYFEMTNTEYNGKQRMVISFSARGLINIVEDSDCAHHGILPMAVAGMRDELIGHIVKSFGCYELFGWSRDKVNLLSTGVEFIANSPNTMNKTEWKHHGWKTIHFITDRGVSHELVRHRPCSFAQESTRYCNYGLDKFGKEITVVDQGFVGYELVAWREACSVSERIYFELLDCGATPQMARAVLPTCVKTEIVTTATISEWEHVMNLRYHGTTGAPHPMIKELVQPLEENGVFDYETED